MFIDPMRSIVVKSKPLNRPSLKWRRRIDGRHAGLSCWRAEISSSTSSQDVIKARGDSLNFAKSSPAPSCTQSSRQPSVFLHSLDHSDNPTIRAELSRVARANMFDYLPVGSHGDPVLDFSQLTRDQAAARVEVTGEDFVDGRGENARELRRIRIKLANRIDALELLGKHYKLYVDPHEQDFGGAGLAARFE